MQYLRGSLKSLLAQQSGQIQLFIIAPILTLSFLSLVVRTASSAVDSSLEKKKVIEQLKRRLNQVRSEEGPQNELAVAVPTPPVPRQVVALTPASKAPTPQTPIKISLQVKKHATLGKVLQEQGVGSADAQEWLASARQIKEFKRLSPGKTITLSFVGDDADQTLKTLSYETNKRSLLVLEKKPDGTIASRRETLPVTLIWRAVGGRIDNSLYKAARKAGVPIQIVDDLADMDWDLDFSDLQPGDTFKVIFEEFQRDGKPIERGRIVVAEIATKGKTFTLFPPLPEEKGQSRSSSSSRAFLRYPLKFTRISSVFTTARFHPILERIRPHKGVDFAAPRGTPVRAVASGKVTFAGRQGGYGNIVCIDHPGPYDTAYAHLERIEKGLARGDRVERGQVIGYVGSTGLATGPHLHFELHRDGEYINPLVAKLPIIDEETIPRRENPAFAEIRRRAAERLSALKIGAQTVSLALAAPPGAFPSDSTKPRKEERFALAATKNSSPVVSDASDREGDQNSREVKPKRNSRSRGKRHR
ncbi:MAG TPA: peptidoglycan DD-metalloendopeptidase family protein [Candidatus Binatia bacterium]|jgi:murein DD-endopeptidase MepM/ murein hydrolase activator NlpD|nr:peptidoglycan DD-metalloendopeptidase family protein [Candidatus Binatia bacterium]